MSSQRPPKADRYKGMQCAARNCSALTRPRSRYCHTHANRLRLLGHPEARAIPATDLVTFAGLAGKVLTRNANHAGLQLAYEELDFLLADASNKASRGEPLDPATAMWAKVAAASCDAMLVMVSLCAAVMYEHLGGRPAPDKRAYVVSVARAVQALTATLRARPTISATTLYALGEALLSRYGTLARNVVEAVRRDHEKAQRRQVLITTPLT